MSSQTIATSTRGLPDLTPWPDHRNNHSDLNHDSDLDPEPPIHSPMSSHPSWNEMDDQQRNQAVGNLLAALAPLSPTSPQTQQLQTASVSTPAPAPAPTLAQTDALALPDLPFDPLEDVKHSAGAMQSDLNVQNLNIGPLPDTALLLDAADLPPLPYDLPIDPLDQMPDSFGPDGDPSFVYDGETLPPVPRELSSPEKREKRQVEAFAKLEFDDGNYYITTYACELGRDAFAYKAALAREQALQAEQEQGHSSSGRSGRRSGLSQGVPIPGESQVQGSVVSEAGGFGGVDDDPMGDTGKDKDGNPLRSHSSQMSAGSVVRPQELHYHKPQELHYHPPPAPFDYHGTAERQADFETKKKTLEPEDEQPAPVTEEHLPDANRCPLIPIHSTQNGDLSEVACHRNISRRHVRIEWSDKKECFQMHVLGKNGAFLGGEWCQKGQSRRLRDGSKIQIAGVEMTFRLPLEEKEDSPSDESPRDVDQSPVPPQRSTSPTSDEEQQSVSPLRPQPGRGKTKITLKPPVAPPPPTPSAIPEPAIGPDGLPLPVKRRGPGRPPKDGIMSTRERKEREKAAKLAEAKAANGGTTPPPMRGSKPQKPVLKEEDVPADLKPEKRKYKKRKRDGEEGDIVQSIEGGDVELAAEPEKPPPVKKARSKSPSPDYPPAESLTEEQLARPSEPYARLIYDILLDIHPKALPLKQIYRALKLKFPFFVHRVDSEGWQSSVRHNLNQEWNKLFEKGEKEGKGFAWKAIPGALQPQAERRRAAQQASAAKPKPNPTPRQNVPQGSPQTLNWQNSTPYSQNGMPPHGPPFYLPGAHGAMAPPPNGVPWPPNGGVSPSGPYPNGKSQAYGQNPPPPFPMSQGAPHLYGPAGSHRSPAGGSTPVPPMTIPTSTSASRNMPCTLDGLITIKNFENEMLKTVQPAGLERWQRIFHSARNRLLHGHPESLLPGGDSEEEKTIMNHMRGFIQRFRNPNFVGFSVSGGSPAPTASAAKTLSPQPNRPVASVPAVAKPANPGPSESANVSESSGKEDGSAPSETASSAQMHDRDAAGTAAGAQPAA
jgi:hypothetical protein